MCGLRPDEKMLDVGCGIGRKTIPLTKYLTKEAIYEGIEINSVGVDWCSKKITPLYPNFKFQRIDVYNRHYNPQGRQAPSEYSFPFPDVHFDFVMLGSVFTHLPPEDLSHYLSEIYRVLKREGRCLITYFLLNEKSMSHIKEQKSMIGFKYDHGVYSTVSDEVPELAIAFREEWITDLYREVGLDITRVEYGSWSWGERENLIGYQDMILAARA
jgi:ubiquinone/menaquinone biosynthesis C-methylase UbiE